MRKFNLTLTAIVLVLLLTTCLYNFYLLHRPLFIQKLEIDPYALSVINDIPGGRVLKYQIGSKLLQGVDYKLYIDHYHNGELVERHDYAMGRMDSWIENRPYVQLSIYLGVNREEGRCWFGFGSSSGSSYGTVTYAPDASYHYPSYEGPAKLRFEKNKPLMLAAYAFSDQVWPSSQPGPAFDKSGTLILEALQHGDIFLVQFEFFDREN